MERGEILELMGMLKLYGMRLAYDEVDTPIYLAREG